MLIIFWGRSTVGFKTYTNVKTVYDLLKLHPDNWFTLQSLNTLSCDVKRGTMFHYVGLLLHVGSIESKRGDGGILQYKYKTTACYIIGG